jgi:dephospho-CoA kinase
MSNAEQILYPTGHHAVGKTELCDYLVDQYGFEVVETGAMVRSLYAARQDRYNYLDLGQFINQVEIDQPSFFDERLAEMIDALDKPEGRVIVNGMRTYENIERSIDLSSNSTHSIIWLEAQLEALNQRYNLREGKNLTEGEFSKLLEFDLGLGLAEIKANANFIIENNSSVESLRLRADSVMRSLGLTALHSS